MKETSGGTVLGMTARAYSPSGRILTEQKTVGSITKTISFGYNSDGRTLASVTYPSGHTVSYSRGNAGRILTATDTAAGINYAQAATYSAHGRLTAAIVGKVTGGFTGITRNLGYNSRLQLATLKDFSSNGTVIDHAYSYNLGLGANNGSLAQVTDNQVAGRTQSFLYDHLKRVTNAQTQATTGSDCWGQNFSYDRFGNVTNISEATGYSGCTVSILNVSVDQTTNRLSGSPFTYDAAGNLTNDGTNTYAWDAEKRLSSAAGVNYTYDGLGRRVQKSSGEIAWYTPDGRHLLAETDSSGNITAEYVYFGGRQIARREGSGSVYYYSQDKLHSNRAMTNSTGVVEQASAFYPYGGERVIVGTKDSRYKFTGKKRDSETQIDHAKYRMYSPNLARWLSVDAGRLDISNPQALNRYAYVLGNPLALIDPMGDTGENPTDPADDTFGLAQNGQNLFNQTMSEIDAEAAAMEANWLAGLQSTGQQQAADTGTQAGATNAQSGPASNSTASSNSTPAAPTNGFPFGVQVGSTSGPTTTLMPDGSTLTTNQVTIQAVDEDGNPVTGDYYMNQSVQLIAGTGGDMSPLSNWPPGGTVVDNLGGLTSIQTQGGPVPVTGWMIQQQTWFITSDPGSGLEFPDTQLQGTITQVVVINNGVLVVGASSGGYIPIQPSPLSPGTDTIPYH